MKMLQKFLVAMVGTILMAAVIFVSPQAMASEVVGEWNVPIGNASSTARLECKGSDCIFHRRFHDGSRLQEAVIIDGDRIISRTIRGQYYRIASDGRLMTYDQYGFVGAAPPRR